MAAVVEDVGLGLERRIIQNDKGANVQRCCLQQLRFRCLGCQKLAAEGSVRVTVRLTAEDGYWRLFCLA